MARRRKGREVDGILLLDKPAGISSNQALQRVKHLFGAAKAGHTGALDPLATGLLPICLGEATKFSQYLLDADKVYRTTAKLGVRTASGDADGEVIEERPVETYSAAQIEALLAEHLSGEITQTPSMYSALKHQGQPLYKLARKGIEVEVKSRRVTVHRIELLDFRGDELDLEVSCSKGTYIRSIVEALGELLGCGAHVTVLRRLETGPYKASMMHTLEALRECAAAGEAQAEKEGAQRALDALLLPAWTAVETLPRLWVDESVCERLKNGQRIPLGESPRAETLIFSGTEEAPVFLGIGEVSEAGVLLPRRLIRTQ
ncbi:tRNA pseudouridine(55) synthase TruB [Motiliproteus sp. SC1-56]|uniref:tRNA pseudouridine(55) synthase TruB n=1 Tax=Motiliproteus sp. SC1-56 TaxID=2799565 RepID=UPI001A8F47BE|nr:tRNA pseudouridine(55) synthase TruB [Motiliproteus sp. SC1-56]